MQILTTLQEHSSLFAYKEFCKSVPSHIIIVLDEAYKEYVQIEEIDTNVELLKNHNNLVITRTFSKIYGLAGLRLGYAMANESITKHLKKLLDLLMLTM